MRRRYYLALAGSTLIGGCTSDEPEEIEDEAEKDTPEDRADNGDTSTPTETKEDTPTETEEPAGSASLSLEDHSLQVEEGDYSTDVWVDATVVNDGDGLSGTVNLTVRFYNNDGDLVSDGEEYLQVLKAGETWHARIYHLGSDAENIEDYEIEGEFEEEGAEWNPEGLELVESELQSGEDEAIVTGRVENTSGDTQSYIQAVAIFYDGDGNALRDGWTNQTDVPDGDTWRFEIDFLDRRRAGQVADHDVLLTNSTI